MVSVPRHAPIRVSSSKVVRVVDQGAKLMLVGRKDGQAVISHGQGAFRVEVTSLPTQRTYSAFQHATQHLRGLTIDLEAGKVLVRGQLLRWRDWLELRHLARQHRGQWQMLATIDKALLARVQREFQRQRGNSVPRFRLELNPFPRALTHPVLAQRMAFKVFTSEWGLVAEPDPEILPSEPSVRLRLTFAEVQTSHRQTLGLNFADGQTVELLPKFRAPRELAAALSFLASQGQARILATPSLTARSGTEAEFLAGGEFAVRTSKRHGQDVSWKRHGLWLKFKPTLSRDQQVRLDIHSEFSMPDFANAVDGIPSLRSSKTVSSVDLTMDQTILLSGLIRSWEGQSWSGLSGLAHLPLLGRLFRSQDFAQNRTELMLFVHPETTSLLSEESDTWD